jgi:hypothetical protein
MTSRFPPIFLTGGGEHFTSHPLDNSILNSDHGSLIPGGTGDPMFFPGAVLYRVLEMFERRLRVRYF